MDLNHRHDGTIRLLYRETLFPGPWYFRASLSYLRHMQHSLRIATKVIFRFTGV